MIIAIIVFFAAFTQGAAGFGFALVSMPLLVGVLGIRTAAPLVSLVGVAIEVVMLSHYRHTLNLRAVIRISVASLAAVPLGVFILRRADSEIITAVLGAIILGYALYALFSPQLPALTHPLWAYGFGFVAGLLSGAYNTAGPPVIIYGSCRRWPPAEFKSNLQAFFLLNSAVVLVIHAVSGNFTPLVWRSFGWGAPAILLGLGAGFSLDRWLNPQIFHRFIMILLLVLGGRLLFFS